MDIHLGDGAVDLENVRLAHEQDLAVQSKYGVKHIHYYINPKEGMGFCLMSGPDKESCIAVHREAHGNVANNIIEVEMGTYEMIMGNVDKIDSDLVQFKDGLPDQGNRFVLVVGLIGVGINLSKMLSRIGATILKHEGRISHSQQDKIIAFFSECNLAVHCAGEINLLSDEYRNAGMDLKIGLATGKPVTETGDQLFGETIKLAGRLAIAAPRGQGLVSHKIQEFFVGDTRQILPELSLSMTSQSQQEFLSQFIENIEDQLNSGSPSVEKLSKQMGVSRPQLYRKIKALSGSSPREFIEYLRLSNAPGLIKTGNGNISEVAYQLGFSHPSIFSRQFKKRFGMSPSHC
jgi:AraC-like DNA-binding protein